MNVESLHGKGTVYLIDDDTLIRESLLDALGMMRFEVIGFSSAVLFLKNLVMPHVDIHGRAGYEIHS